MADSHPDIPDFQEMYSLAYLTGYIVSAIYFTTRSYLTLTKQKGLNSK